MTYTQTEREVADYCKNNEFISMKVFDEFKERLDRENNFSTFTYYLEKFINSTCPKCNTQGFFKWHFLGKLKHPECNYEWYVSPGVYSIRQLKNTLTSTGEFASSATDDSDKSIEGKAGGCLGFIFMFFIGLFFRLPFALLMIPIQAIVSLTQKKQNKN